MRNTIIPESYPIYRVDRIAKRISTAIPACKQITINKLINSKTKTKSDILFMMHKQESGIEF